MERQDHLILVSTSVGTLLGTADTFSAYQPAFLPIRNLYWQQGSGGAGWLYRIGKITPDQIVGTSFHLNPTTTFLPFVRARVWDPACGFGLGGRRSTLPERSDLRSRARIGRECRTTEIPEILEKATSSRR